MLEQVLCGEDAQRVLAGGCEPVERERIGAHPVARRSAAPQDDRAVGDRLDAEPPQVFQPAVEGRRMALAVALAERSEPAGGVAQRVARAVVQQPRVAARAVDPLPERGGPVAAGGHGPAHEHVREPAPGQVLGRIAHDAPAQLVGRRAAVPVRVRGVG